MGRMDSPLLHSENVHIMHIQTVEISAHDMHDDGALDRLVHDRFLVNR